MSRAAVGPVMLTADGAETRFQNSMKGLDLCQAVRPISEYIGASDLAQASAGERLRIMHRQTDSLLATHG
ncbi:MAG: hypothetical protein FGM40_03035 [Rhodocyclaceae bacterium]|nr:hypothetical protein [Rhodocyclaceae bacterium]